MAEGGRSGLPPADAGSGVCVVLVTAPDAETGLALVRELVESRLAACGNLISGLTSVYRWKGEVLQDQECLIIFKTTPARVGDLRRRVVELHPYDIPEFLTLPVVDGHPPYLEWVREAVAEAEMP